MTNVAALEAVGLGRRYGTKWGLRDCSLSVPEGSITGLVGPNGAGKSRCRQVDAAPPCRWALTAHDGERVDLW
jgi:ABC-type branched-subunit amino acid transport system ATPase component